MTPQLDRAQSVCFYESCFDFNILAMMGLEGLLIDKSKSRCLFVLPVLTCNAVLIFMS